MISISRKENRAHILGMSSIQNRSNSFVFTLLLISAFYHLSNSLNDEYDVGLDLIKHQPCSFKNGKSKWVRKLEFESGSGKSGPTLKPRPDQPQCYTIGGSVTIYEEFRGDFSIYLELRSSANKKQAPESCTNQRPDGCGGFGSCLYCSACETLVNSRTLKAQLLLNGKSIICGEGLKPGSYDNLELAFCLPEFDEILQTQGLTRETFKNIVQTENKCILIDKPNTMRFIQNAKALRSIGIFATVYVFDNTTEVKKLMQTQMKIESVFRKSKRSFFRNEPLPAEVYWSLPFNQMIKEQRGYVACHKIYGNIKIRPATSGGNRTIALTAGSSEASNGEEFSRS